MKPHGSIVYVAGADWARDASYARALSLAKATGHTLAVLSDTHPGGPRPPVIRDAFPPNTTLAIKVVEPATGVLGLTWGGEGRPWLRQLPSSVWLLRPESPPRSRVVVAAVELRGTSPDPLDEAVVSMASSLARADGAELVVVHAWALIGEPVLACPVRGLGPRRVRHVLAQVRRDHEERLDALLRGPSSELSPRQTLGKGGAAEVIRDTVRRTGADTLVLGYRGRTGLWGTLQGNLAESFLGTGGLSVVAVRPGRPVPGLAPPSLLNRSA